MDTCQIDGCSAEAQAFIQAIFPPASEPEQVFICPTHLGFIQAPFYLAKEGEKIILQPTQTI